MIKNIIFDVGGVLFSYRWREAMVDAGFSLEAAEEYGSNIFDDPLWQDLDRQIVPYWDKVEELANKYAPWHDAVIEFLTNVEKMPIDRPKVWEKVAYLKKKGYKLYILSNYSEYMFSRHTKDKPFMELMDGIMVSYMIHELKPNPPIYNALIEKYQLNKDECIFFDDRTENVQGAIDVGIAARVVKDEETLLRELDKL